MTAPTKDEFYAIAFDDVDANLSHEECEEWAEFMTAPTDAETIAALAAQLDTTPDDLSRYAAESVRAPTETPSLTTEQAQGLASRWAFWNAGLKQCADNAEFDREMAAAPMLLATPEREQLFAWVVDFFRGMYADAFDERWGRAGLFMPAARHLAGALGIGKQAARDLLKAAGWPS